MSTSRLLTAVFAVFLLAHRVLGDCKIPRPIIDECVDDADNHVDIAVCIMQETSVSRMVDCVGTTDTIACSTPAGFFWWDGPNIKDVDTNGDGVFCVSPVGVLKYAANSTDCMEREGWLDAIHRCPETDDYDFYLECLCDNCFHDGIRDVFDECIPTNPEKRINQIDFDSVCRGCPRV